ncbi:MAG: response regulator [Anaerolineales bacterium]|nr:response regulator [Anaerolineales bacterium]
MKNILIVEDNPSVADTLVRALKREYPEVNVVASRTGETGLKLMNATTFDLLITDWQLPGISGLQLIMKVRPLFPNMKVIFITAYPSEQLAERVVEIADLYLPKPFRTSVLLEYIAAIFAEEPAYSLA